MCGFVGSIAFSQKPASQSVFDGLQTIIHRGPDGHQLMANKSLALGHARLAILDVADGHQPMTHQNKWIVFNGEIYNYKEIQQSFEEIFQTDSDTEVILKLFARFGPESVARLDGMFAFAIAENDQVFLARDPLGIKPLYIILEDDAMYFASEIKALLPLGKHIQEFPAGHYWTAQTGMQRYFSDLVTLEQPGTSTVEFSQEDQALPVIQKTLRNAVHKRLIADPDVPVGVSLSGGLDSSLVAALAAEVKKPLETFAVGMAGSPDVTFSRQAAVYLNTKHHVREYTFDEMLSILPEVIYYLESYDAALVRSAIPNYFLAQLASQHVKVILTGEGADELFAGYAYLHNVTDSHLHKELLTITQSLHNTNLQRADRMTMAFGLEARVPFLDVDMVNLAFRLPPAWKRPFASEQGVVEKNLLRKAFAGLLPANILHRPKQKFSAGAGSGDRLAIHARSTISKREFEQACAEHPEAALRSREELFYFRIFREQFGEQIPAGMVGRTRSVVSTELF